MHNVKYQRLVITKCGVISGMYSISISTIIRQRNVFLHENPYRTLPHDRKSLFPRTAQNTGGLRAPPLARVSWPGLVFPYARKPCCRSHSSGTTLPIDNGLNGG